MKAPPIVHPTTVKISGMHFQIISYAKLSDNQAKRIAQHFRSTHKFKKNDKGKLFTVKVEIDENSIGMW